MKQNICVIIPTYNRLDILIQCINSLFKQTFSDFQIIVVDNGTDDTSEKISKIFPDVVLLSGHENLWWAGAVNLGISYALENNFQYFLLLNNDTEAYLDYIEKMKYWGEQETRALLGSMVYDIETKEPFYCGTIMNWILGTEKKLVNSLSQKEMQGLIPVTHLPGRGLWIPKIVFDRIGLFDAKTFPQREADYDFTLRASRAGFPLFCNCDAKILNYTQEITGSQYRKEFSLTNYYHHLTAIDGGGNIRSRWKFAVRNCPRRYFIPYVMIKTFRALISYPLSFIPYLRNLN